MCMCAYTYHMAQSKEPLSETERQTLIHALHVAAEQFDKDAIAVRELGGLGNTFTQQAETTRRWAEAIENAGEVIIR